MCSDPKAAVPGVPVCSPPLHRPKAKLFQHTKKLIWGDGALQVPDLCFFEMQFFQVGVRKAGTTTAGLARWDRGSREISL